MKKLTLVLAVGVIACGGTQAPAPEGSAARPVTVAPPPPPPTLLPRDDDPLPRSARGVVVARPGLLASDADAIIGVELDSLRKAALYPMLRDSIVDALGAGQGLAELESLCALDVLSAVSSVVIGARTGTMDSTVLVRGFTRPALEGCLSKLIKRYGGAELVTDGAFTRLVADAAVLAGWLEDDLFIVLANQQAVINDTKAIEARADGTGGLEAANRLVASVSGLPDDAVLWVAAVRKPGDAPMPMSEDIVGATGFVSLSDHLELGALVTFDGSGAAIRAAMMVRAGLMGAGGMAGDVGAILGRIKLDRDGSRVTFSLRLSERDLRTLTRELPQLLRAL